MIFIISCARSGSSILAEALGQHPDIINLGETLQSFWQDFSQTPDHNELAAEDVRPMVQQCIADQVTLAHAADGKIPLDKCPPNSLRVPFLREAVPGARFIHLVRDGRDVALSLMPGVGASEGHAWSHLKPRHWQSLQNNHKGLGRCAVLWQYVVNKAATDLEGADVITVKYEQLVLDPFLTAQHLLDWLELDGDGREVLAFAAGNISDDTKNPYHAAKQDFWYRHDHSKRVGRWREQMSPSQAASTTTLLADTLEKFGYESRTSF